jgi:hypothetical protein
VPVHDLAELDSPIVEKEVWETIKQLPSDKAPGPDGSQVVSIKLAGP